jgi:RND family efflux transporter MFP subunit
MKKSLFALILIVAAVAGAFALLNHNKTTRMETLSQRKGLVMEVPVKIHTVKTQDLERKIKINGVLSAKRQVIVLAETAGQVKSFYKEVGDVVQPGTALAFVDASVIATQFETARASLVNNQRDLERFQKLAQSGAATQQTVDNLRLAVEAANANVVALKKQVDNTTIRSPQKGVVVQRMVEIGSVVGGGAPTFKVADLSDMIMKIGLTEMEIVHIRQGMPAAIHIDALGKDFKAVISNVGIAADMSGRYAIEVLIKDTSVEKGELRIDLAGSVSFDLPAMQNVLAIPREALVNGVKDPKVYVVENGNAKLKRISLELVEGSNAVLRDNTLDVGERVVLTGHQNLYEGAAVRIIQ